jgi:hypothetical protein
MITKRPDSSLDILLTYLYNIVYFYINFYFMQHTDKKLDNLHSKFFFIRNTKWKWKINFIIKDLKFRIRKRTISV